MSKENILRVTLFVSVLAFNPVSAQQLSPLTNIQPPQSSAVKASISNILHKRGLDEEVANEISNNVTSDEVLFTHMLDNLLKGCNSISKEEVLTYLSNEALFRKSIDLHRYDYLISMVAKIQDKFLDKQTLTQLSQIAKNNTLLIG